MEKLILIKYFSDLLTFAENKAEIKENINFYEQIDEKSLESNDELFYDETYTTTDGYKKIYDGI